MNPTMNPTMPGNTSTSRHSLPGISRRRFTFKLNADSVPVLEKQDSLPRFRRSSMQTRSSIVHRNSLMGISIHRKRNSLKNTCVIRDLLNDTSIHRRATFKSDFCISKCGAFLADVEDFSSDDEEEDIITDSEPTTELSVMSRNLYLGADFLLLAPSAVERNVEEVVQEAYEMVQTTDFAARSQVLAREILDQEPDVVCLQEVFKYGYSPSEDPTESVPYLDFLELLLSKLEGKYVVSAKAEAIHMAIPYDSNSREGQNFSIIDDHDVILTKVALQDSIEVLESSTGVYQAALSMPLVNYTGPVVDFKRAYAWVKIRVGEETVLVVNSHLDGLLPIQEPQAKELTAVVEELTKDGSHPVLVGDFNARPDGDVYDLLKGEDAQDPFEAENEPTYAVNEDLTGLIEEPERIDHIFVPRSLSVVQSSVFGKEKPDELNGMYASDHFGLTCTFEVSR